MKYSLRTAGVAAGIVGLSLMATVAAEPALAGVAASDWQSGEKGDVRLVAATNGVGDLETIRLGLEVSLAPGWKTYWRTPGDAGIPPTVDWDGSQNVRSIEFLWPAPERFSYYGLDTFGYGGQVVYPVDVVLSQPGEALQLRGEVFVLICEEVCIRTIFRCRSTCRRGRRTRPNMPACSIAFARWCRAMAPM